MTNRSSFTRRQRPSHAFTLVELLVVIAIIGILVALLIPAVMRATNTARVGAMSTEIANRLRGKHKPEFTPHVDTGDYIVVVNAEKVKVTGNKTTDKIYHHHTGYPGGIKSITFDKLIDKAPERIIEKAVKGMMPKNKLSNSMMSKLKIYAGSEHPHTAQQPTPLEI